jgi:hypothetical protein
MRAFPRGRHGLWGLAVILAGLAWSGYTAEAQPDKDKQQTAQKEEKKDEGGGCSFTGFWKHDVGDTIYHGLKTGARKISHAFMGGSKEQDLQNEKNEQKAKPEEKKEKAPKTSS